MRLNYYMEDFEPVPAIDINLEDPGQLEWLHAIVAENPNVIFFFTIATTDIWDDEPVCSCPGAPYHRDDCPLSKNYKE